MKVYIDDMKKVVRESVDTTPEKVSKYFKTGQGDYGEHDKFIGITNPVLRKIANKFVDAEFLTLSDLLGSEYNEERLLALYILTKQFTMSDESLRAKIYSFYLEKIEYVNNWNLVDVSAHLIIGAYLWDKDKLPLLELAKSNMLWERRIAIVSTWYFISKSELALTFKISELLLQDKHDLIHKATGWMLREAGKKNKQALLDFLNQHARVMPRTMLRYSIEKFSEEERKFYMTIR